ncbi:MAG: hypothetical protein MJZ72_04580 [Bacteroidales bacterium]|nr:hypothetical protein [Bacteroidales bacterium]
MKKLLLLLVVATVAVVFSSCTKKCSCTLMKNGNAVENATSFERELDSPYDQCAAMGNFDEDSQTGIQCK